MCVRLRLRRGGGRAARRSKRSEGLAGATFAKVGKLESTVDVQFRHLVDAVSRCVAAQRDTAAQVRTPPLTRTRLRPAAAAAARPAAPACSGSCLAPCAAALTALRRSYAQLRSRIQALESAVEGASSVYNVLREPSSSRDPSPREGGVPSAPGKNAMGGRIDEGAAGLPLRGEAAPSAPGNNAVEGGADEAAGFVLSSNDSEVAGP